MNLVRIFPIIISIVAFGLLVMNIQLGNTTISIMLVTVIVLEISKYIKNKNNPNLYK